VCQISVHKVKVKVRVRAGGTALDGRPHNTRMSALNRRIYHGVRTQFANLIKHVGTASWRRVRCLATVARIHKYTYDGCQNQKRADSRNLSPHPSVDSDNPQQYAIRAVYHRVKWHLR